MHTKPHLLFLRTNPKNDPIPSHIPTQTERLHLGLNISSDQLTTVFAADNETLPSTEHVDGIIIGGSKHFVNEDLAWIRNLEVYIREIYQKKIPMLGICFGHQIITKALGGSVEEVKNRSEVGAFDIDLTEAGMNDPLFINIEKTFSSGEFHRDVVTILPPGIPVQKLANNQHGYQALAYGPYVRATQFHPEFTGSVLAELLEVRKELLFQAGIYNSIDELAAEKMILQNTDIKTDGYTILSNFYKNFVTPYHKLRHNIA